MLERPGGPNVPLAPYLNAVRHHQLFFAGMYQHLGTPRASPRRPGANGRPSKPAPPAVGRPRVAWVQLALFEDTSARFYHWGRIDLRNGPAPDNPWLAWGLHLAHAMAESRGFGSESLSALNHALVILLVSHADGEMIRTSDFGEIVHRHGGSIRHTVEVLEAMGILVDDRTPTFETWLENKLDGLAPGIGAEVGRWARVLSEGGPRSHAHQGRARKYLNCARPALIEWSGRRTHLREVTGDDVLAHADMLVGNERKRTMVALRCLFAWAKKNGVVFADPTSRIRVGRAEDPVWQPLSLEQVARSVAAATTAEARLVVTLASVHAARSGAIRRLLIDDVDLANRRLTIAGRTRPLDDLTARLLNEWLDYRRGRWPNTLNRHVLLTRESAVNFGPICYSHIVTILHGLPGTIERLRIDRQLEEALVHGADPLHLAAVFGISESTAIRYASSARQLMERPSESQAVSSPRTQVSAEPDEPPEHLGSC
ncbi:MAG: integrase [Acidimicrobiales bacterium]